MSPSSSTKSTTDTKSPSSSTTDYTAVSSPSSISGRLPDSSYSDTKSEKSPFYSTVSSILSDVRKHVRDSSVEYSVVGNSLYLTKGNVRSLRISYGSSSCKLWICTNGKETLDAEFSIYDVGRIASIYVDKYRFLE